MTDFLYPFIEGDERDAGALVADLARSAEAKAVLSADLRRTTLAAVAPTLAVAALAMAARMNAGARVFTFGNGGSATDALGFAALLARPPWGRPLAAHCLAEDPSVVTALGNDVGFDLVFARQLAAHAQHTDVAIGFSTSGNSRNALLAFAEGKGRGLLCIGLAGYGGGEFLAAGLDHCITVQSDSVHRVQETQAALAFALWSGLQTALGEAPAQEGTST